MTLASLGVAIWTGEVSNSHRMDEDDLCSPDRPTRRLRLGHRTCLASAARVSRVGLRQSVGASSSRARSQTRCKEEKRMECIIIIVRGLGSLPKAMRTPPRIYIFPSGTSNCLLQLGRCNVAIKSIYIMHLPPFGYLTTLPPRETGLDYFTNRGSSLLT